MGRDQPNIGVTLAEAQQAIADTDCTELELGMTFLDVAASTGNRKRALQSIRNAITALRTADRFLSRIRPGPKIHAIHQRRERLADRLRAITGSNSGG